MNQNIFAFLLILGIISCKGNKAQNRVELNLNNNPIQIELLGEGIVSTYLYERDIAISPNGEEVIYTVGDLKQTKRCLVSRNRNGGIWSKAEVLNISGEYQDIEPFYFENGNRLFFASNRPIDENTERQDYNIWYSDNEGDEWTNPIALGENINTIHDEFYPSLSDNGNLYFTSTRDDGIGREDIFVSKRINDEYQKASVLDTSINTEYYEFNAFVNPDEDLLIFSSFGRADGLGGGDLYYSKKGVDGKWSESKNMGEAVNSVFLDYCPFIDVTRGNFYFTSERMDKDSMSIENVDMLNEISTNVKNGFGDIYYIGLKEINLE